MRWLIAFMLIGCGPSEPEAPLQPTLYVPKTMARMLAESQDVVVVPSAASDAASDLPSVGLCPKVLSGNEQVHRVIGPACGIVTVSGPYTLDGGSLRLEAGTTLAFKDDGELIIAAGGPAKLIVEGTALAPVTFTAAGDQLDGVWKGIKLRAEAHRSVLRHFVVEWAGRDGDAAIVSDANDVVFEDGRVRGSSGDGIVIGYAARPERIAGVTFERIARASLSLPPRAVETLGAGNNFGPGAYIAVSNGSIEGRSVWSAAGVPYVLADVVRVETQGAERAELMLEPGVELRFGPQGFIEVGFNGAGKLKTLGIPTNPVRVTAAGPDQSHVGIRVYEKGEAELEGLDIAQGGGDGAVFVQHGKLTMKGGAVRRSNVGVQLQGDAELVALDGVAFTGTPVALRIAAKHLGAVAPSNTFDEGASIEVEGSAVAGEVTWRPLAAPVVVSGDIAIEERATLTLEPGVSLRMREGARLLIGFEAPSTLVAVGTAERPIILGDDRDDGESWGGMVLYSNTRDARLQHVQLVNVDAERGGIDVRRDAVVDITDLSCRRCSAPAVSWRCGAKITPGRIQALDGTPAATRPPDDACD